MISQHGWYVDGVDLCNHPNLLDDAGAVLEVLTFLGKSSSWRNNQVILSISQVPAMDAFEEAFSFSSLMKYHYSVYNPNWP